VTAVLPQYGYGRQDRKDEGRVPISAKLVANLIVTAGADRVLTLDLHSTQIQGFFDIPVDHLFGSRIFMPYFRNQEIPDLVVAAPDVGKSKVARAYANRLKAGLAIVEKTRVSPKQVVAGYVIGSVKDKNVLVIDDIIETGGSIAEASKVLKQAGARDIYVVATHGIFCDAAADRLKAAPIKKIVVTDSVPVPQAALDIGVEVLSVAPLLAEAIKRIHLQQSVSALFE
jgi:ribose-phosphate pyrophosphokinase